MHPKNGSMNRDDQLSPPANDPGHRVPMRTHGTDRRRFLAGTAVGAAAVWAAPAVMSVDAASAATQPEPLLFAVSGDGGANRQALWSVDPLTAIPSLLVTFQAVVAGVTDGEALAALGGEIYRLSGRNSTSNGQVLNDVPYPSLVFGSTSLTGDPYGEAGGMTASGGGFLMAESFNAGTRGLFSVTTGGVVTRLGDIDHRNKGLAFDLAGTTLYAVESGNPPSLRTLNPATGATLTSVLMTPTPAIQGATGLAVHPITGELWVLLSFAPGTPRTLATVNPATGVTTNVGVVDDGSGPQMAGIAWL